ncbi:hypothetical protein [Marinobacter sp.]|uniref:hypothetical protein n=1 Tax=Marinobacter sp. TaxID=50741 RepID=UPI003A9572D7
MTASTKRIISAHEAFVLDQLMPLILGYARTHHIPLELVALPAFLSLATVLKAQGARRQSLIQAVDSACLPMIHKAAEGLH